MTATTGVFSGGGSRLTVGSASAACRVVHLLDVREGGDAAIDSCRASLALPAEHHVWVIGSRRDVERCERAGLHGVDTLWSPMGLPRLLSRPMRGLIEERARCWFAGENSRDARVILHAWTWSAAAAIARTDINTPLPGGNGLRPMRTAMIVDAPRCTSSRVVEMLHDRERASRVTSACEIAAMTPVAQAWIDRRSGWGGHATISPPMDAAENFDADGQSASVGLQHSKPKPMQDRVITLGLFGPRSAPPDARWFAFMLGLLSVGGWKLRGVVPAWAGDADRARRFIRDHGYRWDLRFAEEPDREWIGECDAVVVCAQSADDVPMFAAHADAAGVPMVAVQAREVVGSAGSVNDIAAGSLDARHVAGALHRWMKGSPHPDRPAAPKSPRRTMLDALAELWRIDR